MLVYMYILMYICLYVCTVNIEEGKVRTIVVMGGCQRHVWNGEAPRQLDRQGIPVSMLRG